jgi:hypothetical protein
MASPVFAGKLSIVIDDFGYRPQTENQVLALPATISVAVLPNAPHAREMATKAHNLGHEVLIHLPMAPLSKQPLEKDTLRPDMSSSEIERIIRDAYGKVPYAVGLNNHMGSAMTSSLFGMQKVMQALERYNLYFLDSVTIGNTQAMRAAQGTGVKVIKRKVSSTIRRTKRISAISSTALSLWRGATVPPLLSATRTRRRCACCSRWCITCRRISPWCVRAACSTSRRSIPQAEHRAAAGSAAPRNPFRGVKQ